MNGRLVSVNYIPQWATIGLPRCVSLRHTPGAECGLPPPLSAVAPTVSETVDDSRVLIVESGV